MIPGQTKPSTLIMPSKLRSLKCDRTSPSLLWARTWQKQGRIQFIRPPAGRSCRSVVNAGSGFSATEPDLPGYSALSGVSGDPRDPAMYRPRPRDRVAAAARAGPPVADAAADLPARQPNPTAAPAVRDRVRPRI